MDSQNNIFKSTRWTTVLRAGQPDAPGSAGALEKLCEDYRTPLYIFARAWMKSPEDAEDLTQGFFAHFISSNLSGKAGREFGKFRTFLLACFKNFLRDELRRKRRAKVIPSELLASIHGDPEAGDPAVEPALTPSMERNLDALWAENIRRRVVRDLENSYAERGRHALFSELRCLLEGQKLESSHAQVAARLGVSEAVINVEVMRLRERFRKGFREEVGETVASETELNEEFRYLLSLLFTGEGSR